MLKSFLVILFMTLFMGNIKSQCPVNIDFENGDFLNWICKKGDYFGGTIVNLVTGVTANRQTIVDASYLDPISRTNRDYYGNFSLLCPNGSNHCLKLGSDETGSVARTASYTVHIPATANDYSVTYWYAVVFEDPGHALTDQPKFTAKVLDNTNTELNCASFTYVATSNLPGFFSSAVRTSTYYKPWTPVTFDLSGRAGQTVTLEFTAEDCGLGGHFGYAYIDVNSDCGKPITASLCPGSPSMTLKGPEGFQDYSWTSVPGNQSLGNGQSITLTPAPIVGSLIKVDLTPFPGFGCAYSIITPVTSFSLPSASISGTVSICGGAGTTLGFSLTGQPPWTVQYKENNTQKTLTTSSAAYSMTVTPTATSTYTIIDVADANCDNNNINNSVTVTVNSFPTPYAVQGTGNYCNGGIGRPVSILNSQTNFSYQLFFNGSAIGTPLSGTGSPLSFGNQLQAGTYTVSASNINRPVCNALMTGNSIIKIDPLPAAYTVTGGGNYCSNGTGVAIGLNGSETIASYQLLWNNAPVGNLVTGNGSALQFGKQLQAGTYTVSAVNKNNTSCQQTMTGSPKVIIDPLSPVFSVSGGGSYCINGSGIPLLLTGSSPGFQYQVLYNNAALGGPVLGTGAAVAFGNMTQAGNYTVKAYTVSNTTCIQDMTGLSTVSINPLPVIGINGYSGTCLGTPVTFAASGASSYVWSSSQISSSLIINPHSDTIVTVTGTDANGCMSQLAKTVAVYALPQIDVTAGKQLLFCAGDSLVLSANVLPGSGTVAGYLWNANGFPVSGSTVNRLVVYQGGSYSLKVSNSNGCETTSPDAPVTVIPLPQGNIAVPPTNILCDGSSTTLSATGGITGYQWFLDGSAISGATNAQLTISKSGHYTVLLKNNNCSLPASNDLVITVLKKPTVDFKAIGLCVDIPVSYTNLSDSSSSGQTNWTWDFGDGNTAIGTNNNHTYTVGTTYPVLLTAIPAACPGLFVTALKNITIDKPENAVRYEALNALINKSYTLTARNFGDSYLWLPGTDLTNPGIRTPSYNGNKEHEYQVRITKKSGCVTIDTMLVRVFSSADIFIATAFTPNGDGVNDKLFPLSAGLTKLEYFKIYNRWGQLMYSSDNISEGWDGNAGGKQQPMATYTWIVKGTADDGRTILKTGNTLLIR